MSTGSMEARRNGHHLQESSLPRADRVEVAMLSIGLTAWDVAGDRFSTLDENLFFVPTHRVLFRAIKQLLSQKLPVTPGALLELLPNDGEVHWAEVIAECFEGSAGPGCFDDYLAQLQDMARRRKMALGAESILAEVKLGSSSERLTELFERAIDGQRPKPSRLPGRSRLADLITNSQKMHQPVVDGLLRRGEIANIIAPPKIGKSWLTYSLSLCIATGGFWLDRFKCIKGRALLLDNELHAETIAHRLPVVCDALHIPMSAYEDQLDVVPLRGRSADLYALAELFAEIEPNEYDVIILDAWYRFLPPGTNENDNAQVMALYNQLDGYAARLNAAFILIHHSSKGAQSEKSVVDVGAGASAPARAADCHLIMRSHEEDGVVVLDAACRSFPPVEAQVLKWEHPLWVPDDRDLDPQALKGRKPATGERQQKMDQDGMARLLDELARGPATESKLRGETGFGLPRIDRLLANLITDGKVTSRTINANGNECEEYRLTDVVR